MLIALGLTLTPNVLMVVSNSHWLTHGSYLKLKM
jgi:hypothetical protein